MEEGSSHMKDLRRKMSTERCRRKRGKERGGSADLRDEILNEIILICPREKKGSI